MVICHVGRTDPWTSGLIGAGRGGASFHALHRKPQTTRVALCNVGIGLDYGGVGYELIPPNAIALVLDELPRLGVDQVFVKGFCEVLHVKPATSFDNFLRDFDERYITDFKLPSGVDFMMNSPFKE